MKKIFLISSFLTASVIFLAGCLKDEGFDNQEYGINDPDTQPPGVGFPLASKTNNKNTIGLNFVATSQTINDILYINLETGNPASSDVHITLKIDTMKVLAYNALPGTTDLKPLLPSQYQIATTVTIPAGARNVQIPIVFPNASALNPNLLYGLDVTIESVDGGYKIAENLKTLLLEFTIKNAYDGYYNTKGEAYHPSFGVYQWNTEGVFACGNGFSLVTSGSNSVDLLPGQPLYSGGITYFSAVLPRFTVNTTTNKVTITTTNSTVFDQYPAYDSRYDPATKTFFIKYGWSGTRIATDTFTFCGPR